MKPYFRLLKLLGPYRKRLVLAMIYMVIFSLCNGLIAFLSGPALRAIFDPSGLALPRMGFLFDRVKDLGHLYIVIPLIIIAVSLVKALANYGHAYYMGYVGEGMIRDLRGKIHAHMQSLSLDFFSKTTTGSLISRIINDVNMIQNSVSVAIVGLLKHVFTIVVLIALVFYLDWRLTLIAIIVFPISVIAIVKFGTKLRNIKRRGQSIVGSISSLLQESISGTKIVKAFGMEDYERKRFDDENESLFVQVIKGVKIQAISSPLMELLGTVGFAGTIWYAGWRIMNGSLTPEEFISFFAAVMMLYQPIKNLSGVNNIIQQGLASAERVFEIIDVAPTIKDSPDAMDLPSFSDNIEFKGVYFQYKDTMVLKNINLTIKAGNVIALVGPSGGGKSTIANLVPRFYDVTKGSIMIDGIDIKSITLRSLRSKIGIVTQEIFLFNDTIRNNISYGDISKREEDIIRAAKAAYAHEFITGLPNGYDTIVGERGESLSGGERQRISIARALLKDAPILILDEATSSLDSESEEEVRHALDALMKGRTTIVIAHRLSTIRGADRILVIADGEILEDGVHQELLKMGGEYTRLYNIQFKDEK